MWGMGSFGAPSLGWANVGKGLADKKQENANTNLGSLGSLNAVNAEKSPKPDGGYATLGSKDKFAQEADDLLKKDNWYNQNEVIKNTQKDYDELLEKMDLWDGMNKIPLLGPLIVGFRKMLGFEAQDKSKLEKLTDARSLAKAKNEIEAHKKADFHSKLLDRETEKDLAHNRYKWDLEGMRKIAKNVSPYFVIKQGAQGIGSSLGSLGNARTMTQRKQFNAWEREKKKDEKKGVLSKLLRFAALLLLKG